MHSRKVNIIKVPYIQKYKLVYLIIFQHTFHTCFYIPVMLIVILKNQFHLISINTSLILFAIVYVICLILITRKVKLPIVSKSRFLNNNLLKIKSDLLIKYSLEFEYITIDYDKIEFHLNPKAFARFKNIKK